MEEKLPNHVDLAMLDIADTEHGTDVAGGRGYFPAGARRAPQPGAHQLRSPSSPDADTRSAPLHA